MAHALRAALLAFARVLVQCRQQIGDRMRVRLQTLAMIALLASSCSSDVRIRLLEPHDAAPDAASDAGNDAAVDAGSGGASGTGGASGNTSGLDELVLRYDFSGSGTRVADRVGSADARVVGGAALDGMGGVVLDGKDDYVDLPNRVISKLSSASFVVWLEWSGGVCWQRIFDFGSNDAGEDAIGSATSSLFLTPASCPRNQLLALAEFTSTDHGLYANGSLPSDRLVQVALVIDAAQDTFALYTDGKQVANGRAGFDLQMIDDVNNWLGRSQWVQDNNLRGRYDEFRIYAAALSARDIATLYNRGPDRL